MIDTHAHLNLKIFKKDLVQVLQSAQSVGVTKIIVPATNLQNAQIAVNLAKTYCQIYASVGIHPEEIENIQNIDKSLEEKIKKLLTNPKVIAIGECGLDYYWEKHEKRKNLQQKLFKLHLEIAKTTNLPLIIHNRQALPAGRQAETDFIKILNEQKTPPAGVFHCFSGSQNFLNFILNLGFFIGFDGNITYNQSLKSLVLYAPLEKILIETDSPYLTPQPLPKTQRNEPKNVKIVASQIAKIKNLSLEKVVNQTSKNALNLFRF